MSLTVSYNAAQLYWQENAASIKTRYIKEETSFLEGLMPEFALQLSAWEVLTLLEERYQEAFHHALEPTNYSPSPVANKTDAQWLKRANMVGINVRTIDNFFNIIKYALTLPAQQDSIHILPIWEPGVVSSLYGISSWNINTEFFSQELYQLQPHLDTTERQLKFVVNLLHIMGKTVGMDVIPHTDRYAQIVLAHPSYFEWLQRSDIEIIDHRADLYKDVEQSILNFLHLYGSASKTYGVPKTTEQFFTPTIPEDIKYAILFGEKRDVVNRQRRRGMLVQHLYMEGYETVPATMAPPYRGLKVDTRTSAMTIDEYGRIWRDYAITEPQTMSRVFGPLTRFQLYRRKDDNKNWEVDFDQPKEDVWQYIQRKYADVALKYGFDFMRGDMSHVQMRAEGVPAEANTFYDPHRSILNYIRGSKPYFGYFAETFLAPPNVMAYGDEVEHLERSLADTTLGDLQSRVPGSEEFLHDFKNYLELANTKQVSPNFTILTADKDDPRFDKFYTTGNEARYFTALFLPNLPSYMGLGFECRDVHLKPAPNEHYTKLFVFHFSQGPKATKGPYRWGQNGYLFARINRMRLFFEKNSKLLPNIPSKILLFPSANDTNKAMIWLSANHQFIFIVNWNMHAILPFTSVELPVKTTKITLQFSTHFKLSPTAFSSINVKNNQEVSFGDLLPGEGRIYILD